ncbi:unnamed protein product [Paramecium octaurelia]|uniref:Uncharacterized protein n=1 Tax=Paramecium octaurelia TaxID=43137 RepID=A0A8S1U515_PAROT|nr:unnamed protein product [Paramecium octaurelia]
MCKKPCIRTCNLLLQILAQEKKQFCEEDGNLCQKQESWIILYKDYTIPNFTTDKIKHNNYFYAIYQKLIKQMRLSISSGKQKLVERIHCRNFHNWLMISIRECENQVLDGAKWCYSRDLTQQRNILILLENSTLFILSCYSNKSRLITIFSYILNNKHISSFEESMPLVLSNQLNYKSEKLASFNKWLYDSIFNYQTEDLLEFKDIY